MGYEIKLIIGKARSEEDEFVKDLDRPFTDGSGYPNKKDEQGRLLCTGRKQHWFQVMAEIDLCKLGYQDDALNELIAGTFKKARDRNKERFYFFYASNGNTEIVEDCYGEFFWPVPVKDVLKAMRQSHKLGDYRRTNWAMALLAAMAEDSEGLEVIFYGH